MAVLVTILVLLLLINLDSDLDVLTVSAAWQTVVSLF